MTIHPAVSHYRNEDGTKQHKSVVVLSDETSHKASTVYAFLKALTSWCQAQFPHVQTINYLSDSPTSQYRNSLIFVILNRHQELFGDLKGTWQYFESGHGKGPCDGLGAAVKRAADLGRITRQTGWPNSQIRTIETIVLI